MPDRITRGLALGLCALALTTGSTVRAAPVDGPTDPMVRAEAAERDGRWADALDGYLRAYADRGPSAELKDKIRVCLRNAAQFRRHRDPAFQDFVVSLSVSEALNVYVEVVEKLGTMYVDSDRATPDRLFALGLGELDRALADPVFQGRYLADTDAHRVGRFRRSLRDLWSARLPATRAEARHAARQLVLAAQKQIGVENSAAVVLELLCGACSGLDEYTVFLAAGEAGLAAPVGLTEYGIVLAADGTVDTVDPYSWAASESRIVPGQRVVRLNGVAVTPAGAGAVAATARRPTPFGHELVIEAADGGGVTVLLPVPCPTVLAADQVKDGVGYVRLTGFRETTAGEIDDAVLSLRARGLRALVLDVRGNPGGLLAAGIDVTERFLPGGVILSTRGPAAEFDNRVFASESGMTAFDVPLVVLVDGRTMSAAEVLALALKDHDRATLVGMPTFGKGVVQAPVRLLEGRSADGRARLVVMTVAAMYGPRGRPIADGVPPDVIESDPDRQLQLAVDRAAELAAAMRDTSLRAVWRIF